MRLTSTNEDTGLSDSAYELVSGTDSESQDGYYTESMGDSVASLDAHRTDDAYSLAGTENTYDDESVADDSDTHQMTPDVEEESRNDGIGLQSQEPADDEGHPQDSIEYVQRSLSSPSLSTPKASKLLAKRPSLLPQHNLSSVLQRLPTLGYSSACGWRITYELVLSIFGLVVMTLLVTLSGSFIPTPLPASHLQAAPSMANVPRVSTTTDNVGLSSSTTTSTWPLSLATSSMDLESRKGVSPDDWLFGTKAPVVYLSTRAHGEVLIQAPKDVMRVWLSQGCLIVVAKRGDTHIDTIMSPADDGLVVKFPMKEAYGTVQLRFRSTCKPKTSATVKVHFSQSSIEAFVEHSKKYADELFKTMTAAASREVDARFEQARRGLGWARQSWVSSTLGGELMFTSKKILDQVQSTVHGYNLPWGRFESIVVQEATRLGHATAATVGALSEKAARQLPYLQDAQSQARLALLDAQVSANLWWLKVTGRAQEHDEYQQRAHAYISEAQKAAAQASRRRHADADKPGLNFKTFVRSARQRKEVQRAVWVAEGVL